MEVCSRCLKSEKQAKLLDAVEGNEIVKVCEECSVLENIPIIRKPSSFQLRAAEKPYTVYERLSRMSGINKKGYSPVNPVRRVEEVKPKINLENIRKPKDYSKILSERQEIARKANKPLWLVDNFNWQIKIARRDRKISTFHLASLIGETESTIRMMEDGFLPDDANRIIGKIEQTLSINLRRGDAGSEQSTSNVRQPARILNFKPETLNSFTIADLKKLKEQRQKLDQEETDRKVAERLAWAGKSKEERIEEKKKEMEEEKGKSEETLEEKKSRKSFWDIFRSKDGKEEEEEISEEADGQ
jgi:ribosome-binding protein aMBF1 (putative translation factor)